MSARLARLGVKAALTVEILATFVVVRLTMREPDIRTTLERLREGGNAPPGDLEIAFFLARAVHRVLGFVPRRSRCLVQSLVLTKLLARRGIASSLVIAVAPGPQLEAHAWIESGQTPLLRPATSEQAQLVRL